MFNTLLALQGLEVIAPTDAHQDSDSFMRDLFQRINQLKEAGVPEARAHLVAMAEQRVKAWPLEWGNRLKFAVYGDFVRPSKDLAFPDIGIEIGSQYVQGTMFNAACVLFGYAGVRDRTWEGLADACSRLNTLVGLIATTEWGNGAISWWSEVTHSGGAGMLITLDEGAITSASGGLLNLNPESRKKVESAMYWMRDPKELHSAHFRSQLLRVYAGYWNAFECLIEAVCEDHKQEKQNPNQKQAEIDKIIAESGGVTPAAIQRCYREVVDPGFVAKASHALRVCLPEEADGYIHECFRVLPKEDRLYQIRNSINHGDIEEANFDTMIGVQVGYQRLWMIVFRLLGQFIPIRTPVDCFKP